MMKKTLKTLTLAASVGMVLTIAVPSAEAWWSMPWNDDGPWGDGPWGGGPWGGGPWGGGPWGGGPWGGYPGYYGGYPGYYGGYPGYYGGYPGYWGGGGPGYWGGYPGYNRKDAPASDDTISKKPVAKTKGK